MSDSDGPEVIVAAPDSFSTAGMFDLGVKLGELLNRREDRLSEYDGPIAVVIVDPRTGEAPTYPEGCTETLYFEFEDGRLTERYQ